MSGRDPGRAAFFQPAREQQETSVLGPGGGGGEAREFAGQPTDQPGRNAILRPQLPMADNRSLYVGIATIFCPFCVLCALSYRILCLPLTSVIGAKYGYDPCSFSSFVSSLLLSSVDLKGAHYIDSSTTPSHYHHQPCEVA